MQAFACIEMPKVSKASELKKYSGFQGGLIKTVDRILMAKLEEKKCICMSLCASIILFSPIILQLNWWYKAYILPTLLIKYLKLSIQVILNANRSSRGDGLIVGVGRADRKGENLLYTKQSEDYILCLERWLLLNLALYDFVYKTLWVRFLWV